MNNNEQRNSPESKCVKCSVLLAIMKALKIDVDIPQACSSALPPDKIDVLLTRKEVMHKLKIKDSTYTRWIERGILLPRIMGRRHFYTEDDLSQAFEESKRKGKR